MSAPDIDDLMIRFEAAKAGEDIPPPGRFDDEAPDFEPELPLDVDNVVPLRQNQPQRPAKVATSATMTSMGDALKASVKAIGERMARGAGLAGVASGLVRVDSPLDGWQRGKVYVLAGRSGMGKSIVALNLALRIAAKGEGVDYVTIEMPTGEQAHRSMFCWSGVASYRWKSGTLRPSDWEELNKAVRTMSDFTWVWDDASSVTVEDIAAQVKRAKARLEGNLFLVVIDHVLNIKGSNPRQPRREQVIHITGQLKALAKSENLCILALAQLNRNLEARGVKDKRPQISDLKESGSFEEDADAILLLFREDHYQKDRSKWTNVLEVSMPKIRGGEPSFAKLRFEGASYRIDNLAGAEGADDSPGSDEDSDRGDL